MKRCIPFFIWKKENALKLSKQAHMNEIAMQKSINLRGLEKNKPRILSATYKSIVYMKVSKINFNSIEIQ